MNKLFIPIAFAGFTISLNLSSKSYSEDDQWIEINYAHRNYLASGTLTEAFSEVCNALENIQHEGLIVSEKKYTMKLDIINFIVLRLRKNASNFCGSFKGNQLDHAIRGYVIENFECAQWLSKKQIPNHLKRLLELANEANFTVNQLLNINSLKALGMVLTAGQIYMYISHALNYKPDLTVKPVLFEKALEMQKTGKLVPHKVQTAENLLEGLCYLSHEVQALFDIPRKARGSLDTINCFDDAKYYYESIKNSISNIDLIITLRELDFSKHPENFKNKTFNMEMINWFKNICEEITINADFLMQHLTSKNNA